jgi:hypothetical protein
MYKKIYEKEKFEEMANLSKQKTGLDYIIWVFPQTGKEKHWARIKVQIDNNRIPISISDNPKILSSNVEINAKSLNKIKVWIVLNKEVLLNYWNAKGKISIDEILDKLKKV